MTRRRALVVALSVAAAIGLATWVYVGPVSAHPGNTCNPPAGHGNPGCHVAATTTTTAKPTTTTTAKPTTTTTAKPTTTTTAKPTTTTVKPTTTTTKAGTKTTASNTTTTLQPTTTTASTTSTTTTLMPAGVSSLSPADLTQLYGSPDERKTMEAARAIVAGLALSSTGGPPDSSGPAGGPPSGPPSGKAAGLSGAAADEAATAGGPELPAGQAAKTEVAMSPSYYFVSPLAIILLLVYATSLILYKTELIRLATHRSIWNILLWATFVIVGASGVILAIGVSQDPPWMLPQWLLFWHVEMGITMAFISFFHLAWLASTRPRSSPAERVAAASR
jgi:hypothetical protein